MFLYPRNYDVIVVGAGHSGVEAALAAARMGCSTLLLTISADGIGQMSCNPAIGGLAKGHLVREIDALGGEMGLATDMTGLQFRMLNTRKGPSVWAPRAQCDKKAYQFRLKWVCEREPNLHVKQAHVSRIIHKNGVAHGVETTLGVQFHGCTVVVTTGTFLRGLMHIGGAVANGGRSGEISSQGLSASLIELGLELGRLKTGTPPRILRDSIDFSATQVQPGDEQVSFFSYWIDEMFHVEQPPSSSTLLPAGLRCHPADHFFRTERFPGVFHVEHRQEAGKRYPPGSILSQIGGQLPCYLTFTTAKTAEIIHKNIHRSPMYSGAIEGVGPRYCPSIEDKFVRFADKEQHQIFLEPEGIATDEIYVNGCSTSLPFDVQVDLIRSIRGCEEAEIVRPAYAVEYDFAFPTQLFPSLETKCCRNLYLAGQINGTSGYEEAASQGLMAGINAARRKMDLQAIVLRRDQAYIGVLIDDLVTKGTREPYRMFTSRAEHRLLLRQDNADLRLSRIGHDVGIISKYRNDKVLQKENEIESEIKRLESTFVGANSLAQILRRPEVTYSQLSDRLSRLPSDVIEQVEISVKYAGYIARQEVEVERFANLEEKEIPVATEYDGISGLRMEARQKLSRIRPRTIGQASRVSGVTPSDVSVLLVWLKSSE